MYTNRVMQHADKDGRELFYFRTTSRLAQMRYGLASRTVPASVLVSFYRLSIKYEIVGKGSQISTNQKRENSAFSLLIVQNLRPFPDNFVLN